MSTDLPPVTPAEIILDIRDLKTYFPIRAGLFRKVVGHVHAVDGVSLAVKAGETLGIVGESGCGKSTLGKSIVRLVDATSGSIMFEGHDVVTADHGTMQGLRKELQMVFQDPYASLNPRHPVHEIIAEPMIIHGTPKAEARERAGDLLKAVGLLPEHGNRYPHEFSGGQRQRIGIARSLALRPKLIVLDEPVSALDVSIQAQVVNLLESVQEEFDLTYMFIAHDLSVVRHISDRVAVMYLGQIAELATRDDIYERSAHPYTQSLLSAIPVPDPDVERDRKRIVLEGDIPSPSDPPSGCRFRTRCPIAQERCAAEQPMPFEIAPGHTVACHFPIPEGQTLVDLVAASR